MIKEIKDEATSKLNLNLLRLNNLKCKYHPDQYVTYVSLQNDSQNKLLCNSCIIKEKELDPCTIENIKKPSYAIEYKNFLQNLYRYTQEENETGGITSEIMKCLDGVKQSEKFKLQTASINKIKSELKKEFSTQFHSKLDGFQKDIFQLIEKIKITLNNYFDQQLDLIFSPESITQKQFKEKECKTILLTVQNLVQQIGIDEVSSFENIQTAINRLHTGKAELSCAHENSVKIYKNLLLEFDKRIKHETLDSIQKIIVKNISEIQSTNQFLSKKSVTSLSGIISNQQLNYTQNDLKIKKEPICSIAEMDKIDSNRPITIQNLNIIQHLQTNSVEPIKKNNSNSFIIKPISQHNGNTKRDQFLTPRQKFQEDNLALQSNPKQEQINILMDGNSQQQTILKYNLSRRQSKDEQMNKQQNSPANHTPINHQKRFSQPESIFTDNNKLLQVPYQQNINNTNKQTTSTSLFSSFSSTLRTKSTTSIPTIQQQFNSSNLNLFSTGVESFNSNINLQSNTGPDTFLKVSNQLRSTNQIKSFDNLSSQQQLQSVKGQNDELSERDLDKYSIGQPSSSGLTQNQKRNSCKGDQLSSFPKDFKPETIYGLNKNDKNISLTNNSRSNTKEQHDYSSDKTQVSSRRQTTKLNAYTNQDVSSIQRISPSHSSTALGSRMKNNIVKNVLVSNTTKQINSENLRHSNEIVFEKHFKYNILSLLRLQNHDSNQQSSQFSRSRRFSLEQHCEDYKNSHSNSSPKNNNQNTLSGFGSSGKLEDMGSFLLASPDGYLSLFNVQGRSINQIYKERTHIKLNSIAIGSTGGMFFTAGEQSKTASIKLWIFHSQQRFSELVELKMADSNIKKIFFIKEEYASSLNKLSFAIWTQTITELNKSEIKKSNEQDTQTVDKIEIWNLEFAGNKFEGAKMQNVSNVELPTNILNVQIKDNEMVVNTKDTLTLYQFINNNSSINKTFSQKFYNIIKQDTIVYIRQHQQCKNSTKNSYVFTQQGQVIILNDQLNIIQEKGIKDKSSKHITLEDAIIYDQDCDLNENRRFLNFFKKTNKTLYVFDVETLKVVDEISSHDEIKNIFVYGSGHYLGFEKYYVRIWKPLPQKQQIISSIKINEDN